MKNPASTTQILVEKEQTVRPNDHAQLTNFCYNNVF